MVRLFWTIENFPITFNATGRLLLLTNRKTEVNACCNSYGWLCCRKMMHSALAICFISFLSILGLWHWIQFLKRCFNTGEPVSERCGYLSTCAVANAIWRSPDVSWRISWRWRSLAFCFRWFVNAWMRGRGQESFKIARVWKRLLTRVTDKLWSALTVHTFDVCF